MTDSCDHPRRTNNSCGLGGRPLQKLPLAMFARNGRSGPAVLPHVVGEIIAQ